MMVARRARDAVAFGVAAAVVIGLGLVVQLTSYEVWGAVLIVPVLTTLTLVALRFVLRRDLRSLYRIFAVGFVLKMIGVVARFYVYSNVYNGVGDAGFYYGRGLGVAAGIRSGDRGILHLIPWARELKFVIRLTGSVLTFTGPTKLGATFVFGTLGYWGAVLLVLAAHRAVPGLDLRRYAWLCMVAPSLVYWPSSIGKEAWVLLSIGTFSLGMARLLTGQRRLIGLALVLAGSLGIGAVRLHLLAILLAGSAGALLQLAVAPPRSSRSRRRGGTLLLATISTGVMVAIAFAAARTLKLSTGGADIFGNLDAAIGKTTTITKIGGSTFDTVDTRNPLKWPWAIFRTLTRPFPTEVSNPLALLTAIESNVFLVALVATIWRTGIRRLVATFRQAPYLAYTTTCTLLFGLVFAAFANLGILARQRSLVAPFMLLLLCLPKPQRTPSLPDNRVLAASAAQRRARENRQRVGSAASRA